MGDCMSDTKEAYERAMDALKEDRWLSPISIDHIRAHVAAQDATIAELERENKELVRRQIGVVQIDYSALEESMNENQLKNIGVEQYLAAKVRITELERERDERQRSYMRIASNSSKHAEALKAENDRLRKLIEGSPKLYFWLRRDIYGNQFVKDTAKDEHLFAGRTALPDDEFRWVYAVPVGEVER